ncbi:MAG: hypothetical protein HY367_02680 [Candidatus Aenigmarchaeota archaeon]|nr:hypothetical protein [Candidatus Aenigmarchaeota archaeon]
MDRKYLPAAAIIILLAAGAFSGIFSTALTGFQIASRTAISLSIASITKGELTIFSFPGSVEVFSPVEIKTEFTNTGSVEYDSRTVIQIQNFTHYPLVSFYDGFAHLKPGERRFFKATYTPNMTGFHWILVNVTFGGSTLNAFGLFFVNPLQPIIIIKPGGGTTGGGGGDGGGGGGFPGFPPESGAADMELVYQKSVKIPKGGTYDIYLEVKNTGEVSLNSLVIQAKSVGIEFDIIPSSIFRIPSGGSQIFIIELSAPKDLEAGEYLFEFTVAGKELSRDGAIHAEVGELSLKEQVDQRIANYLFILQQADSQIKVLQRKGSDVSTALSISGQAHGSLDAAAALSQEGKYVEALDELENTKSLLGELIEEIAEIVALPVTVVLPAYIPLLLIVLVIALLVAVFLIVHARRKGVELGEYELGSHGLR